MSISRASMRSRQARTTASQVASPAATARTISLAVSVFSADLRRARVLVSIEALTPRSILAGAARRRARDAAEHRARGQPGAAGIVEIEQPAHELAGGIEDADRLVIGVEHLGVVSDAHTAEGEGEPAGHRVALERRLVDGVRPIALVDGEAFRAPAVLDVGIERNVGAYRLVVLGDGREELLRVHALELVREILDGVGDDLGDLPDLVLVALQMLHLAVEDLPGELAGLLQYHATVFGIGVVAEVRALVDEALAVGIDENGERIGVLLELIAHRQVAKLRRVHLPLHRVAARPVAAGTGADLHRHADAVAGVEARASHLGEVPAGSEIARAPLRVRFEAAAGEHHGLAAQLALHARVPDAHALDAHAVVDQAERTRLVSNLDAALGRRVGEHLDQPRPAADRLDGEAAPELELALDLERLAAVDRDEAHALVA